jgi:hypothetical protein
MGEMGQRRFNPWTFAGDLMVANMQIGAVLWHRLSSPQSGAEKSRMVAEKIAAASSGVFEAQKAALRLSRDMTLGKVSRSRAANAAAELGAAASKPGMKTLKANAKRLGKRSSRK